MLKFETSLTNIYLAMYEKLIANLSRYVNLSSTDIDLVCSLAVQKTAEKKSVLLRPGEHCDFESYVVRGCIRKYFTDADGNEVNVQFGIEDSWVGDISFSIYETMPSQVYIETLEDCEFLTFTPESKEKLFSEAPVFERVFRILMQRNLAATQRRLFNTIAMNATEKYLEFLKYHPTLPQRIAQHHIASYLGMSAEFLSKTRTRLSRQ
jgi:CRP-like cAMP-binding protein